MVGFESGEEMAQRSPTFCLLRNNIINITITSVTDAKSLRRALVVEQQLHDTYITGLRSLQRALNDALKFVLKTNFCRHVNIAQLRSSMRSICHRDRCVGMLFRNWLPMSAALYSFILNDAHIGDIMLEQIQSTWKCASCSSLT